MSQGMHEQHNQPPMHSGIVDVQVANWRHAM
jgi:hypothetical protein